MTVQDILFELQKHADLTNIEGMKSFGITPDKTYGVRIPILRQIARKIGKDHILAQQLWNINTRETRILTSMIEEKECVTEDKMEEYVAAFDYWEICDQFCMNLFETLPFAYEKAQELADRSEEFARRTGFVMIARLAVSDKKASNEEFMQFFPFILKHATDERNMVKKGVNWALRQIGKRNTTLHKKALKLAEEIEVIDNKTTHWIAKDALRELRNEKTIQRIKNG